MSTTWKLAKTMDFRPIVIATIFASGCATTSLPKEKHLENASVYLGATGLAGAASIATGITPTLAGSAQQEKDILTYTAIGLAGVSGVFLGLTIWEFTNAMGAPSSGGNSPENVTEISAPASQPASMPASMPASQPASQP